jgi:glycerophosphoryl diester phosphodiesterase
VTRDRSVTALDRQRFLSRPVAHRGLHNVAGGVVENSLPAFDAAIRGGFGIECDLQPAADSIPVVFHDERLERLTVESGPVDRRAAAELARIRLRNCGTGSTILTFADMLARVDGRVPIFAEVKSGWGARGDDAAFIAEIARLARAYRGPLALMSFDPAIVAALANAAPEVPRGLVSGSYRHADGSGWLADVLDDATRERLREIADLEAVGASFVAYEVAALPTPRTAELRASGVPVLAWTVRTPSEWTAASRHADQAIFEGEVPD